ncbi:hypothetical protein DESC_240006 [Desulfosarcina cetonica]|nr:hypothetical protein DESC_240006 [Desulfosarcina cetonica]
MSTVKYPPMFHTPRYQQFHDQLSQPLDFTMRPGVFTWGADLLQRLKILFEAVHATSCLPDDAT